MGIQLCLDEIGIQDTSVPVRWCVDKETLEQFKKEGIRDLHLLIIVWGGTTNTESRYLVPINEMMAYVNFYTPGENKIIAAIVWQEHHKKDIFEIFLEKESRHSYRYYFGHIFDKRELGKIEIHSKLERTSIRYSLFSPEDIIDVLEIKVPEEAFAKEPPAWLKSWGNLWFKYPARDECGFRKRLILAFTIQPVCMLAYIFFISAINLIGGIIFTLFGIRGLLWKTVYHPWKYRKSDIGDYCGKSIFFHEWKNKRGEYHPVYILLGLMPIFPISILAIMYFSLLSSMSSFIFIKSALLAYGSALVCLGLGDILNCLTTDILKVKKLEEEREDRQRKITEDYFREIAPVVCNSDLRPSLSALPPKKRTVRLYLTGLKAKACRNFARR